MAILKLGELITEFRHDNNISQREFARRAGLTNSLISFYEKGYNPQTGKTMSPDLETYKRIADGMGITVQSLFEQLGDDATVKLDVNPSGRQHLVVVPDKVMFTKIMEHMPASDYDMVIDAFNRAYNKMKEEGIV